MKGKDCSHSAAIFHLVSTAVLFLLFCPPPVAIGVEFSNAISYPVGISPVAVAVGDFNGDGKLDLAVVNQGDLTTTNPGNVSILLGKGDGTFQAAVNYPAGQTPNSIAVGDFNGDGKLDLAVANQGIVLQAIDGSVSILLGKGDGTFQAAVDYTAGKIPSSIAAGDLNGDGKPDLAVVNAGDGSTVNPGNLSILLGIGDGTFQPAVDYQPCPSPISVQLADFNLDGKLDVLALDQSTTATSGVMLGNGDGTFQHPLLFTTQGPARILLGEFNGDGRLDLAQVHTHKVLSSLVTHSVYLFLGNGDGTFQPPVDVFSPTENAVLFRLKLGVAAEVNGDGRLDLVGSQTRCHVNANFSVNCLPPSFLVLLGRGDGTFVQTSVSAPVLDTMVPADLDGDHLPDLAGTTTNSSGNVVILLNTSPTSGADLAVTMSGSPDTIAEGQNLTYTIRVTNEGPQDATVATVTDMLPPELTLVSTMPSQGSCQGTSSINCDLGPLPSPRSAMVTATATVNAAGTNNTITNQASVSATESDLNTANNSASAVTNVQDFVLNVSEQSLTVAARGSATATVSLSPVDGFNQTATLTCTGTPSNATCEISPGSLTLDGSNTASAILTVKTTARSSALPFAGIKPLVFGRLLPIFWAVFLMLLILVARYARDSSRRNAAPGITLAAITLLVVTWAACGGGNGGGGPPPPEVSTLTVTATAGSFTQSTHVTLTIK